MDRISLILPSYYRHNMLRGVLENITNQRSNNYELEVVIVTDDDVIGAKISDEFSLTNHDIYTIRASSTERLGQLAAWNYGLTLARGNYFVHMGDDGRFHGNALELAYNTLKDRFQGYGMVAFNDWNLNGDTQVGTHVIFNRQFCKDVLGGVMVVPHYKAYCVDLEFNERAKSVGRYYWCQQAILEHLHSSNGKRETFPEELEKVPFTEDDMRLFNERKSRGFPDDFEPVI